MVRYYHAPNVDNVTYHLLSILTMPSVEYLSAIHGEAEDDYYYHPAWTDANEENVEATLQSNNLGMANMKELSLSYIFMSPSIIGQLLCYYPNLRKISFRDCLGDDEDDADNSLKLEQVKDINLMAKISQMSPQLQELAIFHWVYVWSSIMTSSMSSLALFKCLRRLETNWPILTRCDHMDVHMGM